MGIESATPGKPERWPRIRRLAKTVGAVIAVIGVISAGVGYVTNGVQFFAKITDYFEDRTELRSLLAAADERLSRADFEAAWIANGKARELAPRYPAVLAQQAQIAMKWLENVRLSSAGGPKTFSEVVDPLKSALLERAASAQGQERADLRAHIGWANFLRYRDGQPKADIVEEFDAAIAEDPGNLYGHVMRGFWILWDGGTVDRARGDFAIALNSGRDPAYSDMLIMSAFLNSQSDEFMAASIEYADMIRMAGRDISEATKDRLAWYYVICLNDTNLLARFSMTLAALEQVRLLEWLNQANIRPAGKRAVDYFIAYFTEQGGKKEEALNRYRALLSPSPDERDDVARLAQAAVNRLGAR